MRDRFLIFFIVLLAFGLRIFGVNFGLPDLTHADEPVVVNHALAYGTGDFNPHFFRIPPLVSYVLFIFYGITFLLGRFAGWFSNLGDFETLFYRNPSSFYWIARAVFGVLLGTLTVYAVYRFALKNFSRSTAFLSALLLAVCFLHVSDSHYVYADIPLVLVIILAFQVFFKIPEIPDSAMVHLKAGCMIGLATAIKYNGLALAIPYAVASLSLRKPVSVLRGWIISGAACLGIYAILNPFSLIDINFFLREVRSEAQAHIGGLTWWHHLRYSLLGSVGALALAAGVLGFASPSNWKSPSKRSLSIFVLGYYVILKFWGQPYARYVLPIVPFVLILAAEWLIGATERMTKYRPIVLGISIMALSAPMFAKSVLFDAVMSEKDTRALAKEWIEDHVPSGSRIATDLEFYMPRLRMSPGEMRSNSLLTEEGTFSKVQKRRFDYLMGDNAKKPSYWIYSLSDAGLNETSSTGMAKPFLPFDLHALKEARIEYAVVVRLKEKNLQQAFYDRLAKETEKVAEFNPYRGGKQKWALEHPLTGGPFLWEDLFLRTRNGQPLMIYRLKTSL